MKISVIEPGKREKRIRIPTVLVLNHLSAYIAAKVAEKNGVPITFEQIYALITTLRDFNRSHADWKFVEVQSAGGEYICVQI